MERGKRVLGIDYGSKRVGVALSDPEGILAFPFIVLENSGSLVDDIISLCSEHDVGSVVVGESKDYSQKDNPIMAHVRTFILELQKKTNIPIGLHPEFLTSAQAEHIQGKTAMHDASAAAIILQSYIDSNPHK